MKRLLVLLVLLVTINSSAQWVPSYLPNMNYREVVELAVSGNNLFAGTYVFFLEGGLFLSTNNGVNWSEVNNGFPNHPVFSILVLGTNIYVGSFGGGVFLTTNNGANWTALNNGLTDLSVDKLIASGTNLFAGTGDGGVFLSTNYGISWAAVNNGLTYHEIHSLAVSGINLFAGTANEAPPFGGGVFLSNNNGTSWAFVGLSQYCINALAVSGTNLFAGSWFTSGVYLSTNNGINWIAVNNGLTNLNINDFTTSGTNVFTGTDGGVFLTTNNGMNWIEKNQGFNYDKKASALLVANNFIFAGIGNSIWRRPLSEIIGIQNISTETPSKYSLSQNYPNPFNSTTNIKFQMLNAGNAKIIVYDVTGEEVAVLINEELQAGTYKLRFVAKDLPSAIYFYRLEAGKFTETKKLILLK